MSIDRGALELRADLHGAIPPMALTFPLDTLGEYDCGAPSGLVLVGLETAPGVPAPSGRFHLRLIDSSGRDVLRGIGLGRSPSRRQQTIVRLADGLHPLIQAGETLRLTITGNRQPGAVVFISLFYGQAGTVDEGDDGRKYH